MKFEIKIATPLAVGTIQIEAPTVPEAFVKLPMVAADQGLGLVNDGTPTSYTIRVIN